MSNTDQLTWGELYGGPADGEQVPVDPEDPAPRYPYLQHNDELHWYVLFVDGKGHYRYYLWGMYIPEPWTRHLPF